MPIFPIVRFPDPRLRLLSQPVTTFDSNLRSLVNDMNDTMVKALGAGLSAIQIGEPKRLFIIDPEVAQHSADDPPLAFVNPELIWLSQEEQTGDEGCLSFPGIFVSIKRALHAKVRAQDLDGQYFELEGEGLLARAFQHENDHQDGRLIIDLVGPVKRQIIRRKMRKASEEDPV
jgi:peptide deformylase